jgi:uncharacterized protein YdeI (BOF family)
MERAISQESGMLRVSSRLLGVGLLVALMGCDQDMISIDNGESSTLTVRAYVDADGGGTFDASDVGIAGATVTATGESGVVTGTTGADGAVDLVLPPGSYSLSMAGDVPAGAVLATASQPVVAAPYRAAELSAEFRYAYLPGSISGRLFRDDNESGAYEAGEDLPAAGITVAVESILMGVAPQEAEAQAVVAETTTDADGWFSFETLRPGAYTLQIDLLETMEIEGGSSIPVTVGAGSPASIKAVFTGTLRIDIADARAANDGQTVSVEGIVTWHPDWDTRQIFIQDATAGIFVYAGDRPEAAVGDRVQITGERGAYDGELQISNVVSFANLGSEGEPDPRPVTAAEINDNLYEAQLATIDGTVEQIDVLSYDNQMLLLRDGTGGIFAVKVDSRTGTSSDDWQVGETYSLTGVLGTDTYESGTDIDDEYPHRLETRGPDDIAAGGSAISIADARGMDGESVVIEAIVTWQNQWDDRIFFFQDATGGLSAFYGDAPEFQRGDLIRLRGTIGSYRGEVQISPDNLQVLGNVAEPTPLGVTGAQINAGEFQGMLVTVTGSIQSIDELSYGNQMVILQDGAGTDLRIYVDSRNGVEAGDWPAAGSTVRVTGVLGTDDRDQAEGMGPRIELRDIDDIATAEAGVTSIAEARGMPTGTVVTIRGVVTWQTQWDSRVYFFQDETGGITTFHFGAPDLLVGDEVTVTGEVSAYRGEIQLGSISDIQVTSPGTPPDPRVVSGSQVNNGLFQGELVQASGTLLEVLELSYGNQRVTIQDAFGTSFTVYVDSRNGMEAADWPAVGTAVQVIGVLGTDDRDQDEGRGPRIETRSVDDLTVVGAGVSEGDEQ